MNNLTQISIVEELPQFATITDYTAAIEMTKGIDTVKPGESRYPIERRTALRIMAEYGAIAYKCAAPPETIKLAIIIWRLKVEFRVSTDGLSGVFIQPISEDLSCSVLLEQKALSDFNSFKARLDGWEFSTRMIMKSNEKRI